MTDALAAPDAGDDVVFFGLAITDFKLERIVIRERSIPYIIGDVSTWIRQVRSNRLSRAERFTSSIE